MTEFQMTLGPSGHGARRRALKQPAEIGYQTEVPLTATRSIISRMTYGKILLVQIMVGRQSALAIPIATLRVRAKPS